MSSSFLFYSAWWIANSSLVVGKVVYCFYDFIVVEMHTTTAYTYVQRLFFDFM